jgi:hypothetical protein
MVTTLCRDCSALAISATRCERCGVAAHDARSPIAALHTLTIAHVDCDAFDATVAPSLTATRPIRRLCSTRA